MTTPNPEFKPLPFKTVKELFDAWKSGERKFWLVRGNLKGFEDGIFPVRHMELKENGALHIWDTQSKNGNTFAPRGHHNDRLGSTQVLHLVMSEPTKSEPQAVAKHEPMPSDLDGIARVAKLPKVAPPAPPAPPSTIKPTISGLHVVANPDKRTRWGI